MSKVVAPFWVGEHEHSMCIRVTGDIKTKQKGCFLPVAAHAKIQKAIGAWAGGGWDVHLVLNTEGDFDTFAALE